MHKSLGGKGLLLVGICNVIMCFCVCFLLRRNPQKGRLDHHTKPWNCGYECLEQRGRGGKNIHVETGNRAASRQDPIVVPLRVL